MSLSIMLVVLTAALLHATWNFFVKRSGDKYLSMSSVVIGHIPLALLFLLFSPFPSTESIPYIFAGALIHTGYQLFLLNSYRFGDLSLVYPLARGSAPLLITLFSMIFFEDELALYDLPPIFVITIGIVSLTMVKGKDGFRQLQGVLLAFATGVFIASYSLVDGVGARESGSPVGFYGALSIINALIFMVIVSFSKPGTCRKAVTKEWRQTIIAGSVSFIAYALVIWAFTKLPIAHVSALRETSIIFALLLGVVFLKEKLTPLKLFATITTFAGVCLLRLVG